MPSLALLQRDHEASPHLKSLIERSGQFEVTGLWHTVHEARAGLARHHPDLLMADLRVQDGDVTPLLRDLRTPMRPARPARPHVLVTLVSHDDQLLLEALRAGADGYWVHAGSPDLLLTTLEQLVRGESPMSPTLARHLLHHFDRRLPRHAALTGDEREILQQLAQGYLIDEIATKWHASVHSIACGIRGVLHKLQFDLRAGVLTAA
jgi:DNA-binding NarL/FixJ family response regulator